MKEPGILPEDVEESVIQTLRGKSVWIGDDVAILKNGLLISTDTMIEGVHFSESYFSCKDIGYKALAAALSDIAAEGGKPLWYLLNLGLRKDNTIDDVHSFIQGMEELENKYSVELIGGDTFRSPVIVLSITVGGETKHPITRAGANSGDTLYITGSIGGSKIGYYALKKGIDSPIKRYHLRPEIRCNEGVLLNKRYRITSMLDISDGLLIDSHHLSEESKKRLDIDTSEIPICPGCRDFAKEYSIDLMEIVLTSGEEFELLFTSSNEIKEDFVHPIGKVSKGKGVYVDGKKTPSRGYRHFSR